LRNNYKRTAAKLGKESEEQVICFKDWSVANSAAMLIMANRTPTKQARARDEIMPIIAALEVMAIALVDRESALTSKCAQIYWKRPCGQK